METKKGLKFDANIINAVGLGLQAGFEDYDNELRTFYIMLLFACFTFNVDFTWKIKKVKI